MNRLPNDICQVCGEQRALHAHHRKLRSQGGGDEKSNLLRVCLGCHAAIHANPSESYARGLLVHSWDDPEFVEVYSEKSQPRLESHAVVGDTVYDMHTHEIIQRLGPQEGEPCPTCKRRIPHKKKASTPKSKVWSTRVPLDDAETFSELVDAAAEHHGLTSRPYHRFWTLQFALVLLLQAEKGELPG